MPEHTQIMFKHSELLELLIKKAGLTEGKWQLITTFGFAGANFGPTPDEVVPAAVVGINAIGLQKATAESPPSLTADAAIVNPRKNK